MTSSTRCATRGGARWCSNRASRSRCSSSSSPRAPRRPTSRALCPSRTRDPDAKPPVGARHAHPETDATRLTHVTHVTHVVGDECPHGRLAPGAVPRRYAHVPDDLDVEGVRRDLRLTFAPRWHVAPRAGPSYQGSGHVFTSGVTSTVHASAAAGAPNGAAPSSGPASAARASVSGLEGGAVVNGPPV